MSNAINDACRAADAMFQRAKSAIQGGAPPELMSGTPNNTPNIFGTTTAGSAAEQLKHNSGWVSASIRPIAQSAAGQPIRLASIRKRVSGPAIRSLDPSVLMQQRLQAFYKHQLPLRLKGFADQIDIIDEHPFLETIREPNELMTSWALMFVTVVSTMLTGRGFWWMPQVNGRRQFWHMPTPWVKAINANGRLNDSFEIRPLNSATPWTVPGEEIAQFYIPDAADPLSAVSPTQTQSRAITADELLQEAQQRAFKNGLFPGLILTVGRQDDGMGNKSRPKLTDGQKNQIINTIRTMYRGVYRNDEPFILDAMIEDIKKLSNVPKEMDFLNSGKQTKSRVSQGFGVNPWVMGDTESSNRASAVVAMEHFFSIVVNPMLEMFSQIMTKKILPIFPEHNSSLLAYIEPARSNDIQMLLLEREQMIRAGALTRNELRAYNGLPPLPGKAGDTVILMPGMALISQDTEFYDPSNTGQLASAPPKSLIDMAALEALDTAPPRQVGYRDEEAA